MARRLGISRSELFAKAAAEFVKTRGRQDVTIPVAKIDRIDDDGVYLKLNKREIAALPALAMQRHSR